MQLLNDKGPGKKLTGAQWNEVASELQNLITSASQALSSGDVEQAVKSVALYAGAGDFYADAGAPDAYVLSPVASRKAPPAYANGMRIRFNPTNDNTGPATVDLGGLGAKDLKNAFGDDLTAGEIQTGNTITAVYNGTAFLIESTAKGRPLEYVTGFAGTDSSDVVYQVAFGHYKPKLNDRVTVAYADDNFIDYSSGIWRCVNLGAAIPGGAATGTINGRRYWNPVDSADGGFYIETGSATNVAYTFRLYSSNLFFEQFGAIGTGLVDDTAPMQITANWASGIRATFGGAPNHTYLFDTLLVKNGTVAFLGRGSVLLPAGVTSPTSLTTQAAVVLQGALTGGPSVEDCTVSVEIDMQNGDRTAMLCDTPINCTFTHNKIYGFTNHATYNHRGIRLQEAPIGNKIYDNEIEGYDNPTQRGLLIDVWCSLTGLVNFGGFFTGTVSQQPTPAERNIIWGNTLTNGSYALNLQGGEYNVFSNNVCKGQNHRGIWAGNGSWFNAFVSNDFVNFSSTAILGGYSFCHNLIAANNCHNEGAIGVGGEAAININTGSLYNLIIGNEINAPVNYSVYVATDSSHNVIDGNHSKNAYVAAFAVENDWIVTQPTNCFYTRPNYEDPTALDPPNSTSWTYNDLENTVFQNNTVHYGYTGRTIAAFSIAHIQNGLVGATPTKLKGVTLKNNTVLTSTNIGYGLYVFEHVAGQLEDITLVGNTWPTSMLASTNDFRGATPSSADVDMRTIGLIYAKNNGHQLDTLIDGNALVFTDADTTPDVSNWRFFRFNNTGATSVTDFDGAAEGQEIVLRGDVNTTIVYTSGLIRPTGLVDVTGMNSNSLIAFKSISGIWYEMWRNF